MTEYLIKISAQIINWLHREKKMYLKSLKMATRPIQKQKKFKDLIKTVSFDTTIELDV